ncbi:MAG TPA: hypothetical protein PKA54_08300 [Chitinophagaceae bacterium]|nr:MAG: purine or other phosphorylase family 1 [Bacteroidetes bacterium OLB11]HMN33360.1 hypothetical protein [Chitinophagaceae bacterium]
MKIILAAATSFELSKIDIQSKEKHFFIKLVHGIGLLSSVYELTKAVLELKPDFIIQCGIVGAYRRDLNIGDSVLIKNEMIEVGVENQNHIEDLFDLHFLNPNDSPFEHKMLPNQFVQNLKTDFKKVNALTVQICSGTIDTIHKRIKKFHPDVESMEGASLHYVCLKNNIPFLQLKSISNYVEVRNKANWNIELALENNALHLNQILKHI